MKLKPIVEVADDADGGEISFESVTEDLMDNSLTVVEVYSIEKVNDN